jgi:type IV secretory pathway TrbL component
MSVFFVLVALATVARLFAPQVGPNEHINAVTNIITTMHSTDCQVLAYTASMGAVLAATSVTQFDPSILISPLSAIGAVIAAFYAWRSARRSWLGRVGVQRRGNEHCIS